MMIGSMRIISASDPAKPEKPWCRPSTQNDVDEQAGDDRRDAGHHVDEEPDRPAQPAARRTPSGRSAAASPSGIDIRLVRPTCSSGAEDRVVGAATGVGGRDASHRVGEEADAEAP